MKFVHLVLFVLLASATVTTTATTTAAHSDAAASFNRLLILNVHVVSADASVSEHPLNVLIENERITALGTKAFIADKVIDGKGQYLIPGLIDTHVHLRDVPGFLEGTPEFEKVHQQAVKQIPKSYLYAGFTTLLDLANTREAIDQWNRQPLAPQAFFCTPVLIPNGYPIAMMPQEAQQAPDVARHLLHDRHSHHPAAVNDAIAHSPAGLVDAGKKEGARCVKVFYETGFGPMKDLPVPSQTIVRELVAAAHKKDMPVFLHGNSLQSYEFALATGVDMIVHGLWSADKNTTEQELTQVAKRLAEANIAVQPTVQVIYGEQELFNPNFFEQLQVKQVMPAALIKWYQSDAGQWMKKQMGENFAGSATASEEQKYQQVKAVYQPFLERVAFVSNQLHKQKPLLVFGSDTPSGPFYTQFPGLNGRKEMDHWLQMGVSLADLFKAMTIGNAQIMGLDEEIGSVAKNKTANLLLLGKNPLEDVTAYDSISWVILKGQPIAREKLSAVQH